MERDALAYAIAPALERFGGNGNYKDWGLVSAVCSSHAEKRSSQAHASEEEEGKESSMLVYKETHIFCSWKADC